MCRLGYVYAGAWLLLLTTARARQPYLTIPGPQEAAKDEYALYKHDIDLVDTAPPSLPDAVTSLLLEKHFNELQRGTADIYRSLWDVHNPIFHLLSKKRMSDIQSELTHSGDDNSIFSSQEKRFQPKWKIKKGRVSSGVVCYFKLCSFRSF